MQPAPRVAPFADQHKIAYRTALRFLKDAVAQAKRGGRDEWIEGNGSVKLAYACHPSLEAQNWVPNDLALEAFPLLLTALMLTTRRWGNRPYELRHVQQRAILQASEALRRRLAHLASLESGPYCAQYERFGQLCWQE